MKKALVLFIILPALLCGVCQLKAQCNIGAGIHMPGIYQNGNYCFTRYNGSEMSWQFVNDSFYIFNGDTVYIDSVQVAYISNLPCGLFWNTNKTNDSLFEDTFLPGEQGCFTIFGAAADTEGTYYLNVYVRAYVQGSPSPVLQGLYYIHPLSVIITDSGQACPALDTTIAGDTTFCFVDSSTVFSQILGMKTVQYPVENISNYPNPFRESTEIVFNSEDSRQLKFRVYDMVGRILYEEPVSTNPGRNIITFYRHALPAGVYYYNLGGLQNMANCKMIILD